MTTPAAVKVAKSIFGKRRVTKAQIAKAALLIDRGTRLSRTLRTCAIILRDIEKTPELMANQDMRMATYALRNAIVASGYKLDQIDDIINHNV